MENCIFCKIARGKIESDIVFEDPDLVAFNDLNPQAPVHILIIPRKHLESIHHVREEDLPLMGKMTRLAQKLASDHSISPEKSGYRIVINCGAEGGQTVSHLHFHLLGGRQMKWPPG